MNKFIQNYLLFIVIIISFLFSFNLLYAFRVVNVFDNINNTKSKIKTNVNNFGFLGYKQSSGNSSNSLFSIDSINYFHSISFGVICKKNNKNHFSLAFNPDNKQSEFVPGRLESTKNLDSSSKDQYQVLSSRLYNLEDGIALFGGEEPIWPLWIPLDDNSNANYIYVPEEKNRNLNTYSKPYFFGEEHIFSTYKDSDSAYNTNPINIQIEQNLHFFEDEEFNTSLIISYKVLNKSATTLNDFSFLFYLDPEITKANQKYNSITNEEISIINHNNERIILVENKYDSLENINNPRAIAIKNIDKYQYQLVQLNNTEQYNNDSLFSSYINSVNADLLIKNTDLNFFLKSNSIKINPNESKQFTFIISLGIVNDDNELEFLFNTLDKIENKYNTFHTNIEEYSFDSIKKFQVINNDADKIIQLNNKEPLIYRLINIRGAEIIKGIANKNFTINTNKLETGFYMLILKNKKTVETYKIMIKNN